MHGPFLPVLGQGTADDEIFARAQELSEVPTAEGRYPPKRVPGFPANT